MAARTTWILCAALAVLAAACGGTPPNPTPGPETCNNGKDDNGDGKIDCLDPKCFADAHCQVMMETCTNDTDDNGDSLVDCADPTCAGQSCGVGCTCLNGIKDYGTGGGTGGGSGGGSGGGTGGGSGGGTGGGSGGGTGGGSGGGTGGGSGGGTGGGTGGGGCVGCGNGCACSGGVKTEILCSDNIDNDTDNVTDCDDPDCANVTCGAGCLCVNLARKEVNCTDGLDNDGDTRADCADSDCVGAGTEICNDGVDNTCDRAIDCGDSKCTGNAACAGLNDGKPCLLDNQCAGGKCLTEASSGLPNGACSNLASCTVSTNAGCNGGRCLAGTTFNTCVAPCTGTGTGSSGACRAGFACYDPDYSTTNNNNVCLPLCSSDSECSGGGSGYGCNPWSKRCGNLDRGLGKYGAACTSNAQCESGECLTGSLAPGGYCGGPCRGDTKNCGPNGWCSFDPSYGDNYGLCYQACTASTQCRQSANYNCWRTSAGSNDYVCLCLPPGATCGANSQCCSGSCFLGTCD